MVIKSRGIRYWVMKHAHVKRKIPAKISVGKPERMRTLGRYIAAVGLTGSVPFLCEM
jgi:hypothetical protein